MPARLVNIDRDTPLLLPPDLRQWIPQDHLAHYILDAVESLPLTTVCVNERGTGDKDLLLNALYRDPCCGHLTPDAIRKMANELLRAHRRFVHPKLRRGL